jgi:hypothetical protein
LHFILVSFNCNSERAVQETSHDNLSCLAGGIKYRLQVIRFAI